MMHPTTDRPLQRELEARGIAAAAQIMNWQPDPTGQGWRYPVRNQHGETIAWRWKSAAQRANRSGAANTAKYRWLSGKASFYTPPHFAPVEGLVIIANGEPSVLAFVAAGMHNAFSWFGENAVPRDLVPFLRAHDVRCVLYPADKDIAGQNSARKVAARLAGSGITFIPLAWPDDVPDKYDANDLWMDVGFDAAAFRSRLAALAVLEIPPTPHAVGAKPAAPARNNHDQRYAQPTDGMNAVPTRNDGSSQDNTAAWDDVKHRVGVGLGVQRGYKTDGWALNNVSSPFRDDKNPSCTYNVQSGCLYDHGTGDTHRLPDLCAWFGIEMPQRSKRRTKTVDKRGLERAPGDSPNTSAHAEPGTDEAIPWGEDIPAAVLEAFAADWRVCVRYLSQVDAATWLVRGAASGVRGVGAQYIAPLQNNDDDGHIHHRAAGNAYTPPPNPLPAGREGEHAQSQPYTHAVGPRPASPARNNNHVDRHAQPADGTHSDDVPRTEPLPRGGLVGGQFWG